LEENTASKYSEPSTININTFYSDIKDIKDVYDKIVANKQGGTLKGVPTVFSNRLSKLLEEIRSIEVIEKIKDNYISKGAVNIKMEGEDPNVLKELSSKYDRYTSFVAKMKDIIYPQKESGNFELQTIIDKYAKNQEDSDGKFLFQDFLNAVRNEFFFLKSKKFFNNTTNQKYMNVGVSIVDKNKSNVPHYEIYVAIDLMEGEINKTNVNKVKCLWRGLYLGQETENYFSKNNKYDMNKHRVFVPEKEIKTEEEMKYDSEKSESKNSKQYVKPSRPPQGGRLTRKKRLNNNRRTAKMLYCGIY
jgi:hypothetical protein